MRMKFLKNFKKVLFRTAITFVHECLSVGKLKDMSDVMAVSEFERVFEMCENLVKLKGTQNSPEPGE